MEEGFAVAADLFDEEVEVESQGISEGVDNAERAEHPVELALVGIRVGSVAYDLQEGFELRLELTFTLHFSPLCLPNLLGLGVDPESQHSGTCSAEVDCNVWAAQAILAVCDGVFAMSW